MAGMLTGRSSATAPASEPSTRRRSRRGRYGTSHVDRPKEQATSKLRSFCLSTPWSLLRFENAGSCRCFDVSGVL